MTLLVEQTKKKKEFNKLANNYFYKYSQGNNWNPVKKHNDDQYHFSNPLSLTKLKQVFA